MAIIAAGHADFLVTGDKTDLLPLERHASMRILTVRQFLALQRSLP